MWAEGANRTGRRPGAEALEQGRGRAVRGTSRGAILAANSLAAFFQAGRGTEASRPSAGFRAGGDFAEHKSMTDRVPARGVRPEWSGAAARSVANRAAGVPGSGWREPAQQAE